VIASLQWLARHQNPDGSWHARQRCEVCPDRGSAEHDPGLTGLALLAFVGAGYTHLSRDVHQGRCFGDTVKRAIQWIATHQDADGAIGPRDAKKFMYNHAICTLALCETYAITGSMLFKDAAQRAVTFLLAAQNPGKGWRYHSRSGENDASVTGWAVMALASARLCDLAVPRASLDGALALLRELTDENGRTGYSWRGTAKVVIDGVNDGFDHHEAMTAIALMSARLLRDGPKPDARLVASDPPAWSPDELDFYYWYCGTLALVGTLHAGEWRKRLRAALLPRQNRTGCLAGSWDPVDRWSSEGGRIYATAINALSLEDHYCYGNAFGR